MSIYSWSTTAGTNAGADAAINFAEGMLPSAVNDSARAMMAALAAWLKDSGGGNTTGGSTTAYTLTNAQSMLSKTAALVAFKAHATNTGACTLNVDGLGASPLRSTTGVDLAAGGIVIGNIYLVTWVSGSSEWLLINNTSGYLPLAGGTMTGALTLSGAPTVGLHAATKTYVDSAITGGAGYTVTGSGGLSGGGAINTNPVLSIAALGVGTAQLAANAVTTAKIASANVTPALLSQPFTAMGAVTASGAAVNFSSIPSWVKRITVITSGTAFSVADTLTVVIGPVGGVETSGYAGESANIIGGSTISLGTTVGFCANFSSATQTYAKIVLDYFGSNLWCGSGSIATVAGTNISVIQGSKSLAGTLTQLTVRGVSGNSFAAGTVNVFYE